VSAIAGLQDFRREAPPADVGVYQFPADILVFKFDFAGTTHVCAVRGGAGAWVLVDYEVSSATNDSAVIQSALNGLTAGRDWKEKVIVRGDYTLGVKLTVPSYTVLEIQGKLTLADGVNDNMIENSDTTNGNTDIEICGGLLDGNRANNAGNLAGIYLDNVENCTVKDCRVINCARWGIYLGHASYCHIYGCKCSNSGQHGIMVDDHVYYNTVENNICYDNGNHGISLEVYAEHNSIVGNMCIGNVKGIVVENPPNRYNDVIGNIVSGNAHGIQILGSSTNHIRFCNFIGNIVSNNKEHGIYFTQYVSHCEIAGNVCVGNSTQTNNSRDNIYVKDGSTYNYIHGNICRAGINANKPRYGINIGTADCTDNLVINNDLYDDGYGTAPLNDGGTGTIINGNRGNVGFYQEGDYADDWSGLTISGVARNGTRVIVHNTNGAATVTDRLYCYSNGAWHYVDLT